MKHKFKVGDKVRIVRQSRFHNMKIGEECEIIIIDKPVDDLLLPYKIEIDGYRQWVEKEDIEPLIKSKTKGVSTKETQNTTVLKYLRKGRKLTQLKALEMFGIMRLASRINNLRGGYLEKGELLHSVMVHKNGKKFAEYSIEKPKK